MKVNKRHCVVETVRITRRFSGISKAAHFHVMSEHSPHHLYVERGLIEAVKRKLKCVTQYTQFSLSRLCIKVYDVTLSVSNIIAFHDISF